MSAEAYSKVSCEHLQRDAFLYVRQSTPRQVVENAESTKRQYALRDRAVALGWPIERIHIIDNDQGHSGARPRGAKAFSSSSRKWRWATPASSWVWRCRGWPAIVPTGIA